MKSTSKGANIMWLLTILCFVMFSIYLYWTTAGRQLELFTSSWNQEDTNSFIQKQQSINPDKTFDTSQIQTHVSQEELKYFIENSVWPWSDKTNQLYKEASEKNPYVSISSDTSSEYAQSIYNNSDMLYLLSTNSKEGHFLLGGGIDVYASDDLSGIGNFGRSAGLDNQFERKFMCGTNNDGNMSMKRVEYKGINNKGIKQFDIMEQPYQDLERVVPGFRFVKNQCDPCRAFNKVPNYSCPFRLEINNDRYISNIWKYLWFKK